MRRVMVGVAFASLLLIGQPAWAARTQVHEAAEPQEYGRKFGGMIGRGALNAVTCFVDVLVNTVNDTQAGPPLVGTLGGFAKGTGCGVLRLGSGAVDLLTFWVPGFNGFPVSDSYENCFAVSPPAAQPQAVMPTPTPMTEVPAAATSAVPAPAKAETEPQAPRRWKK